MNMGLFGKSEPDETQEQIRGVDDARLQTISTEQLLCIALARFMESQGCDDDALIKELYRRGKTP
jgi:hypothetical protein